MTSKVAVAELDQEYRVPLRRALDLIGGIEDLNTIERSVVVKVGVFNQKEENHASIGLVDAILSSFDKAPKVFVAESDNYKGTGSERLQIWRQLYNERVVPFNLSNDPDRRKALIANKQMELSHILFKPNVLVDTHILRSFENGSILKNLFGCILDSKRVKYHKVLPMLLADVYEAIGGVDLAVLDGTYFWRGVGNAPVRMNLVLVGRDAVAVETVGATLAGLDLQKMPVLQEFVRRGLGEGSLEHIDLIGASLESLWPRFRSVLEVGKKRNGKGGVPQTWGGLANRAFRGLILEGFFKQPNKRTLEDVVKAFEVRGLPALGKEDKIESMLARRVKNGTLKRSNARERWIYRAE